MTIKTTRAIIADLWNEFSRAHGIKRDAIKEASSILLDDGGLAFVRTNTTADFEPTHLCRTCHTATLARKPRP